MDPEKSKVGEPRGVASVTLMRLANTARRRGGFTLGDALASAEQASFGFVMLLTPSFSRDEI
ncbi:hypothetical protein EFD56_00090 [Rhizobium phaseoli]|uniref:hypothetical protein n=1 Tax=Rhizobium phaseoli TaxID=396 RepID=UPI000F866488|nr:hypothetical protein [Rhizobium phaseoli]RUM22350.1 hypothetical protein EFD56_00090 [Rhizobium phaseoli]